MMFIDPATGKEYSADDVLDKAFDCADCNSGSCPIGQRSSALNLDCCSYVEMHSEEAARLIGIQPHKISGENC